MTDSSNEVNISWFFCSYSLFCCWWSLFLNFSWRDDFPSRKSHQSRDLQAVKYAWRRVSVHMCVLVRLISSLASWLIFPASLSAGRCTDFTPDQITWSHTVPLVIQKIQSNLRSAGTNLGLIELHGRYGKSDICWSYSRPFECFFHSYQN